MNLSISSERRGLLLRCTGCSRTKVELLSFIIGEGNRHQLYEDRCESCMTALVVKLARSRFSVAYLKQKAS